MALIRLCLYGVTCGSHWWFSWSVWRYLGWAVWLPRHFGRVRIIRQRRAATSLDVGVHCFCGRHGPMNVSGCCVGVGSRNFIPVVHPVPPAMAHKTSHTLVVRMSKCLRHAVRAIVCLGVGLAAATGSDELRLRSVWRPGRPAHRGQSWCHTWQSHPPCVDAQSCSRLLG